MTRTTPADAPADETGPTARRRQLGFRLFALRDATGLTAEEAGERAGVSKATVSRYERAKGNVRWNQVDQLCRVYGATDAEREALVDLAKNSRVVEGWWVPVANKLPGPLRILLPLEDEASEIRHFTNGVVPGLLQVRPYSEAITETPGRLLPAPAVGDYLDMRQKRQEILDRPTPPGYRVILDEAVLRRVVGGPEVMVLQLDHLLTRAAEEHITIQVLPFSAGAHTVGSSTFMVLGGPDPALDVIYIENPAGYLILEEPSALAIYTEGFAHLRDQALDPDSSADLIAEARKTHLRHQ